MKSPRALTKLDQDIVTLIIGVDTLLGGDALNEDGALHRIANTWVGNNSLPEIYLDEFAQSSRMFAKKIPGAENVTEDPNAVNQFVGKYALCDLPSEIRQGSMELIGDEKANLTNLVHALEIMLKTVLAGRNGEILPSFDERYLAAAGGAVSEVTLADPTEAKESLRTALLSAGYEVSRSRGLRETLLAWKAEQDMTPSTVAEEACRINRLLLEAMQTRIFARLGEGISGYAQNLAGGFSGLRFRIVNRAEFTGYSHYHGGEKDGRPVLTGTVEYNADHPITMGELYSLCGHEVFGHYITAAIQDMRWRDGGLRFADTMAPMCTPDIVFEEGWAQSMFELIYGSKEAASEVHGKGLLIALACDSLEDIGKNNAPILYQRDGQSLDTVRRHIAEGCVQSDAIAQKLSGEWAQHPVFGPMYSPAYLLGQRIVAAAIKEYGNVRVAEIGFGLRGHVDIKTFKDKLANS